MQKTEERRSELLDMLADHVLAEGLAASSLRPLARAAGISDRMLLYYFKDKAEVIAAVLGRVSERLGAMLDASRAPHPVPPEALIAGLSAALSSDAMWPYMRVWLEVVALSARGDPVFRATGEAIARGFLAWGESQIEATSPEARRKEAARVLIAIEGMALLQAVGLEDVNRLSL